MMTLVPSTKTLSFLNRFLRIIVNGCFSLLSSVANRAYGLEGINALLIIMPAKLAVRTLRKYGATVGENLQLHTPIIIHNAKTGYENLVIGNNCYLGRDVFFDLSDKIVIGDNAVISMRCTFITHTDVGSSPVSRFLAPSHAPISLERGAYLGAGSIVLEGVRIGECAMLAAGSVVKDNVSGYALFGGVPARFLRAIDNFPGRNISQLDEDQK